MREQTTGLVLTEEQYQAVTAAVEAATVTWEAIVEAMRPAVEETLRACLEFQYRMSLSHNPHRLAKRRRARRQWRR